MREKEKEEVGHFGGSILEDAFSLTQFAVHLLTATHLVHKLSLEHVHVWVQLEETYKQKAVSIPGCLSNKPYAILILFQCSTHNAIASTMYPPLTQEMIHVSQFSHGLGIIFQIRRRVFVCVCV